MKTILVLLSVGLVMSICLSLFAADSPPKKGKLRHAVAFKFKDTTTPEQIKEVEDAFRALKKKIPEVAEYEWGTNVSPENLNRGFTHAFLLTFKTEKDRDAYLVHPEHKKFVDLALPRIAEAFVIDYWAKG